MKILNVCSFTHVSTFFTYFYHYFLSIKHLVLMAENAPRESTNIYLHNIFKIKQNKLDKNVFFNSTRIYRKQLSSEF